jgi:hypothetical protein
MLISILRSNLSPFPLPHGGRFLAVSLSAWHMSVMIKFTCYNWTKYCQNFKPSCSADLLPENRLWNDGLMDRWVDKGMRAYIYIYIYIYIVRSMGIGMDRWMDGLMDG